jgi:hypothetical protein
MFQEIPELMVKWNLSRHSLFPVLLEILSITIEDAEYFKLLIHCSHVASYWPAVWIISFYGNKALLLRFLFFGNLQD